VVYLQVLKTKTKIISAKRKSRDFRDQKYI